MTRPPGALAACLFVGACWCQQPTATFGTTVVVPSGLRGLIYYLRPGETNLPDFARIKPVGAIYTTSLNVPAQDFSNGFPGVTNRFEWFAIDYTGRFWIEKPGDYQFALTSDDGSILYIDERALINLDGTHAPVTQTARAKMECGIHHIRVSYFQGPRYQDALQLSISGGGKKWRIFNTEEFKAPSNPEDWKCGGKVVPYDPDRRTLSSALKQQESFEADAMAALNAEPRPQAFPVRTAAFRFWQSGAGSQTSVVIAVPGTSLTSTRVDGGAPLDKVHLGLLALVKAADGHVVEKFSLDGPYEMPHDEFVKVRAHDLVFSHPVHLPPGRYTIQAAALDLEGKRTGTDEIVVESAPQAAGIGLSSIVLTDRVEAADRNADAADPLIFDGKRVLPQLGSVLDDTVKPLVYFVVYPDSSNAAKPTVQVQFFNAGKLLAEQSADLPAADASGAIPMFISAATRPGDCELKITVRQGGDSATGSARYRVAAPSK